MDVLFSFSIVFGETMSASKGVIRVLETNGWSKASLNARICVIDVKNVWESVCDKCKQYCSGQGGLWSCISKTLAIVVLLKCCGTRVRVAVVEDESYVSIAECLYPKMIIGPGAVLKRIPSILVGEKTYLIINYLFQKLFKRNEEKLLLITGYTSPIVHSWYIIRWPRHITVGVVGDALDIDFPDPDILRRINLVFINEYKC